MGHPQCNKKVYFSKKIQLRAVAAVYGAVKKMIWRKFRGMQNIDRKPERRL